MKSTVASTLPPSPLMLTWRIEKADPEVTSGEEVGEDDDTGPNGPAKSPCWDVGEDDDTEPNGTAKSP